VARVVLWLCPATRARGKRREEATEDRRLLAARSARAGARAGYEGVSWHCDRRCAVGSAGEAGSWGPGWRDRHPGLHAGMGDAQHPAGRAGASFAEARRANGLGACRRRSGVADQRGRGRSESGGSRRGPAAVSWRPGASRNAAEPAPGVGSGVGAGLPSAVCGEVAEESATTRPATRTSSWLQSRQSKPMRTILGAGSPLTDHCCSGMLMVGDCLAQRTWSSGATCAPHR